MTGTKTTRNALGIATQAIHAGDSPDPTTRASAPAIQMSSTFVVDEPAGFSAHALQDDSPFLYARWSNPNNRALEKKIAVLEGTDDCACFASGMGAASAIFLTLLSSGDHVIVSDVSYAGVAELVRDTLPRYGIEVSLVDLSDLDAVRSAVRSNTRLVHAESPVNPILRLCDIRAIADIAHDANALLSCDSTFSSPLGMPSKALGVDLIMHSLTKYLCGHGDAMGGAVAGSAELIGRLRAEANIHHGDVLSPFNAWLIARGASTLPLRMQAHQSNAMQLASWLETHPSVSRVIYPGLQSHPQHALALQQMTNFSGMLSFQVKDLATGARLAEKMMDGLKVIHYAVSLGHHRSLIFWMPTDELMESSFHLTGEQLDSYRAFAGDGVFRLSTGLEDIEDLIADLDAVLSD